ncbi:MAG: hypothetical protein AAF840_04730 [Bacteroidota bacterium]
MNTLPKLQQLTDPQHLSNYSALYEQSSGLPIPVAYLHNPENRVFGIIRKEKLVGGFILGASSWLRTVEVFAAPKDQHAVDEMAGTSGARTEITCFWIAASVRREVMVNRFTWVAMIYAIARYAKPILVFGTCSRGLARLYATSQHATLIHRDRINNKPVFIFMGLKSKAVLGIGNILAYKSTWKWNPLRLLRKPGATGLTAMLKELKQSDGWLADGRRA